MYVDFKYGGFNYLRKLVALIGKFMKVDQATTKREKLSYARVLIEVKVDQEFLDHICFINERWIDVSRCVRGVNK